MIENKHDGDCNENSDQVAYEAVYEISFRSIFHCFAEYLIHVFSFLFFEHDFCLRFIYSADYVPSQVKSEEDAGKDNITKTK